MQYTVILLYPDYLSDDYGHEHYTHICAAPSAAYAVRQARLAASMSGTLDKGEDFALLFVFEGACVDVTHRAGE